MSEAGIPKSWYPVALSKQVRNAALAISIFGRECVLFRRQSGALAILDRYCAHMGADLSRGMIVGDRLRCGLHGWAYGADGSCTFFDKEERQARGRLGTLAIHETGGIVFVWPGESPDWPFPGLSNLASLRAARARRQVLPCPMEAIGLNGCDIWHYGIVHRRKVRPGARLDGSHPHHLSLNFEADVLPGKLYDNLLIRAGYRELRVRLDYWGGNLIFARNQSGGYLALIALRPEGPDRCEMFLGVFAEGRHSLAGKIMLDLALEVFRQVAWRFLQSDVPFVTGMHPRAGDLVPGKDDIAAEFWRWWTALPRLEADAP